MREAVLANYEASLPDRVMGFFRAHRPLSNFHLEPFTYRGIVWPSSENAYQAMKAPESDWARFAEMTPGKSRTEGQIVKGLGIQRNTNS